MNALNTCFIALLLAAIAMVGVNVYGQPAADGSSNIAATCAACHGAKGEGNPQSNFPRIAGQPQAYLARQLAAYVDGSRYNQIMTPIAKQLSEQQVNALSNYYASLAVPPLKTSKISSASAAKVQSRGEVLATIGDENLAVQACDNCHGPGGTGEPPTYPYLAGQHSGYLNASLSEWKSGARSTDPSQQMLRIAKRLSDSDIAALSTYYAAQPAPASQRINVPRRSATRTASGAATQRGSTPTTG
ncbi:MAG: c-type cytochrome, partial [Burkholderiaceae bacterium]